MPFAYNAITGELNYSRGGISAPGVVSQRTVTAAGAITVTAADYYIIINKTVPEATTVNLPASPLTGVPYVIKDGSGNASVYNDTIVPGSGLIDGAANFVLNTDYQAVALIYDGTNWGVVN